jgi:tyrosinase
MTASSDRDAFIAGCLQLANTPMGITALQVNNTVGPQVPNWQMRGDGSVVLSWWDLFVLWHYVTMELSSEGRAASRAHGDPVFLPWHRMFLLREQRFRTVLGDANFALPSASPARQMPSPSPTRPTGPPSRKPATTSPFDRWPTVGGPVL